MTDGLTTPELTPNTSTPTEPTIPDLGESVVIEQDIPIVDDGLPFIPVVVDNNAS